MMQTTKTPQRRDAGGVKRAQLSLVFLISAFFCWCKRFCLSQQYLGYAPSHDVLDTLRGQFAHAGPDLSLWRIVSPHRGSKGVNHSLVSHGYTHPTRPDETR